MRTVTLCIIAFIQCQCAQNDSLTFHGWHALTTNPLLKDKSALNQLLTFIQNSEKNIRIAAYQINHPLIIENLAKKRKQGVFVEVIGDAKNDKKGQYQALRERGIPVISGNRSGLMHHKFALFDNEVVFTGSGNFTVSGFLTSHNQFFYSTKKAAILIFSKEYQLLRNGFFGLEKPASEKNDQNIFFLPQHRETMFAYVKSKIRESSGSIRFLFFSFSNDDIGTELIKLKRSGRKITGIIDPAFLKGTGQEAPRLNAAKIQVNSIYRRFSPDGYTGGKQHNKSILLKDLSGKPVTITGSFNWSESAKFVNDEVVMIIEDQQANKVLNRQWTQIYGESYNPYSHTTEEKYCDFLRFDLNTNLHSDPLLWNVILQNPCPLAQSLSYYNLSLTSPGQKVYFSIPGPSNWQEETVIQCKETETLNGVCAKKSQRIGFSKQATIRLSYNKAIKEKIKSLKTDCTRNPTSSLSLQLLTPCLQPIDSKNFSCSEILSPSLK